LEVCGTKTAFFGKSVPQILKSSFWGGAKSDRTNRFVGPFTDSLFCLP
jgi:hypothetical protein